MTVIRGILLDAILGALVHLPKLADTKAEAEADAGSANLREHLIPVLIELLLVAAASHSNVLADVGEHFPESENDILSGCRRPEPTTGEPTTGRGDLSEVARPVPVIAGQVPSRAQIIRSGHDLLN